MYVKNFGDDFSEDQLKNAFQPFGPVLSAVVMCDGAGISRGFGFVSFDHHESASKVQSQS